MRHRWPADVLVDDDIESRPRGRERKCLAAVGPGEEHALEHVHVLGGAGQGRDRHPVAQRLAQAHQIRLDAVVLLSASGRQPEAGDDLVEHHQRSVSS